MPKISVDADGIDRCFGCGSNNPIGLKLRFHWDGKAARTEFTAAELYQGWPDIVHGGIITCILDEAMSHAALFEGMNCVTAEMQVKLKRPARINERLIGTASVTKKNRRLVEARASIHLADGTLVAEATAKQVVATLNNGGERRQ
ncbi:MAG: PaaI family thioesterase [Chloroflexi bacterium]|nr:PaaI family thioesterase [Chloroflexota bacterium]